MLHSNKYIIKNSEELNKKGEIVNFIYSSNHDLFLVTEYSFLLVTALNSMEYKNEQDKGI